MDYSWLTESHSFVDVIHGTIKYNGFERLIMESPAFMRLHRVYQSSLAYLTYPSNKVKRFEHSVGTMHLAGEFFYDAVCNSKLENINKLLKETKGLIEEDWKQEYSVIKSFMHSRNSSDICETGITQFLEKPIESRFDCEVFRLHMPSKIEKKDQFVYFIILESVRLAGLLHDIGHLPYSHVMEYALKDIYDDRKDKSANNAYIKQLAKYINDGRDENPDIHEVIGKKLTDHLFRNIKERNRPGTQYIQEDFFLGIVHWLVIEILKSKNEPTLFADLHKITDGIIDCDRMDYCSRDLMCAGISKSPISFDRIFSEVRIVYEKRNDALSGERDKCFFAFSAKALGEIEALLRARFDDFTMINYHHRVHKHEMLLEMVIKKLGVEAVDKDANKNDDKGNLLKLDISSLFKLIKKISGSDAIDIMIAQMDDEWLNALMKDYYFREFGTTYQDRTQLHNDIEWNRFDELIYGETHYRPLFKRQIAFMRLDAEIKKIYNGNSKDNEDDNDIKKENDNNTKDKEETKKTFFDNKTTDLVKLGYTLEQIYMSLNGEFAKWCKNENGNEYGVIDCIICPNSFKIGIMPSALDTIMMVSSQENISPSYIGKITNIIGELDAKKSLFPPFHIFFLPKYDIDREEYNDIKIEELNKVIAQVMARTIKDLENAKEVKKSADIKVNSSTRNISDKVNSRDKNIGQPNRSNNIKKKSKK